MLVRPSFAKINLFLYVLSKRLDNFHNIYTLFTKINLIDYISVEHSETFSLKCNDTDVPTDESNTLCKVYNILKMKYNIRNVSVFLYKNIPHSAGLGGGSSNSAVFLEILNHINDLNLSLEDKSEILSNVSSDAPYFLHKGPKIGIEKGNVIVDAPKIPYFHLLLLKPNISIKTADVYKSLNLALTEQPMNTKIEDYFDYNGLLTLMHNDLENTVLAKYPLLKDLKAILLQVGADKSLVTGSGSGVYGVFASFYKVNKAYSFIRKYYPQLSIYKLMRID